MSKTVGSNVTYSDINLQNYRGVIIALGKTVHGGDCIVAWSVPLTVQSEECLVNLERV